MKAFASTLAFAFGMTALAAAQSSQSGPFYITSPLTDDVWTVGSTETIKWINGKNENITINLIEGKDSSSMVSTGDVINTNGLSGTATWDVPDDIDISGRYAVRFDYTDDDGKSASSYSGAFKIVKGSSSSRSSSAAASTSSAPASSATLTGSRSSTAAAASSSSVPLSSAHPSSPAHTTIPSVTLKPTMAASTTPEAGQHDPSSAGGHLPVAALSLSIPAILAWTLVA